MNQVGWLLVGWVAICIVGIVINFSFLIGTLGDKQFLRQHNLNGVREQLVNIHFREAFSHLIVKAIFTLLGLWSLALRANNDAPLTPVGWLTFGTFYVVLLLITLTDVVNFQARMTLVQKLFSESVVFIPVPVPAAQEKIDDAMLAKTQADIKQATHDNR